MRRSNSEVLFYVALISLLSVAFVAGAIMFSQHPNSIVGSAGGVNRFAYINTYSVANGKILQSPTFVTWSFSGVYGGASVPITGSGSCSTTNESFAVGSVVEVDVPYQGTHYINSAYTTLAEQQNAGPLSICEITLPSNFYNTTSGNLTLFGNNEQVQVTLDSLYVQNQNNDEPILITYPISVRVPSSTTSITTTTIQSTVSTVNTAGTTTTPQSSSQASPPLCQNGYYNFTSMKCQSFPGPQGWFAQFLSWLDGIFAWLSAVL